MAQPMEQYRQARQRPDSKSKPAGASFREAGVVNERSISNSPVHGAFRRCKEVLRLEQNGRVAIVSLGEVEGYTRPCHEELSHKLVPVLADCLPKMSCEWDLRLSEYDQSVLLKSFRRLVLVGAVALSRYSIEAALRLVLLTNMVEPGPIVHSVAEQLATEILQAVVCSGSFVKAYQEKVKGQARTLHTVFPQAVWRCNAKRAASLQTICEDVRGRVAKTVGEHARLATISAYCKHVWMNGILAPGPFLDHLGLISDVTRSMCGELDTSLSLICRETDAISDALGL